MQLTAALLLFTQRFAALGALVALPILTAITAFCWSTRVIPTATIATLMWLGTLGLVLWDHAKWRALVTDEPRASAASPAPIDQRLWAKCGLAIFIVYLGSVVLHGGVYRPRGLELDNPAFYVLPLIVALPIVTYIIERRRTRALTPRAAPR